MTYEQALKKAESVGAAHATGLPHLAQTIDVLSRVHAISPVMTYDAAVRAGMTAKDVRKLSPVDLGWLGFS